MQKKLGCEGFYIDKLRVYEKWIKLISIHALHYSTQHKNYKQQLTVLKCNNFEGFQHLSDSICYLHHKSQTRNYSSIVLPKFRPNNAEESLTIE